MRSGFPELAYRKRTEQSTGLWLTSYLDDLVTRDAALLDQRKDPAKLRRYLQVLSLNNAGLPTDATLYAGASINAKTLTDSGLTGRFFDAFGTAQLRPEIALLHPRPTLHHLRETHGRQEVDLVIDMGAGRVVGVEFNGRCDTRQQGRKAPAVAPGQLGEDFLAGAVMHSGSGLYELGDRIFAVPSVRSGGEHQRAEPARAAW